MKKSERTPIRDRDLIFIPFDDREQWLQIRRGYLGGSDAGAVIGMNKYGSAVSVWAEKTGKAPEFGGNTATNVGTYLEDLVAKLFMEETGKTVRRLKFTIVNPAYPFACANIDREVLCEDAILECKTTTNIGNISKMRSGECPDQWYAQVTHYMAVTGAKKAYLAALENNQKLHIFEIERDEDEINALMEAERAFWEDYVIGDKMPTADGSDATSETIKRLFPVDDGESMDLSEFDGDLIRRDAISRQIKDLEKEVDEIDNRIKAEMKDCSTGDSGRFSVSWKTQTRSKFDKDRLAADRPDLDLAKYTTVTQSRVFRVKENKS